MGRLHQTFRLQRITRTSRSSLTPNKNLATRVCSINNSTYPLKPSPILNCSRLTSTSLGTNSLTNSISITSTITIKTYLKATAAMPNLIIILSILLVLTSTTTTTTIPLLLKIININPTVSPNRFSIMKTSPSIKVSPISIVSLKINKIDKF